MTSLGERLDQLQQRTGVPVMARRTWLQTWLDTHPEYRPLVLGVESPGGSLAAVALLATRRTHGLTQIVAMGHGASDMVTASAVDDQSARELTEVVARHLTGVRPWSLLLQNVHPDDPVVHRLASRLRRALLLDGDVSPVLRVDRGSPLDLYVSSDHRRRMNGLRNRISREGLELEVRHVTKPQELLAVLPEVEHVHRLRDDDVGRASGMDKRSERDFFHGLVTALGERGQVCLTTLRLSGALAAYSLCFVDGTDYRLWNTRFDPGYAQHSPGKLALHESVRHALESGASSYDFMRGDEKYKASYANDRLRAVELLAGSNLFVAAAHRAYLSARDRLRRMDESGDRAGRFADRLRDLKRRLRR